MFLCRPKMQGAYQAVIYDQENLPEIFKLVEKHVGNVREVHIDTRQTMELIVRTTPFGALAVEDITLAIPLRSIVVFSDTTPEILTQQDFEKKYERLSREKPDVPLPVEPEVPTTEPTTPKVPERPLPDNKNV